MRALLCQDYHMACLWHRLGINLTTCGALAAQTACIGQAFLHSGCS